MTSALALKDTVPSDAKSLLRARIRSGTAKAADFVAYNVLRGKPASTGFTPPGSAAGLRAGQSSFDGFIRATQHGCHLSSVVSEKLTSFLTPAQLSQVRLERIHLACRDFEAAQGARVPPTVLRGFLDRAMRLTPQGSGNVWSHCNATQRCARYLQAYLAYPRVPNTRTVPQPAWLPAWFLENPQLFRLSREDLDAVLRSAGHHDCGKPFVYREDEDHRAHFPDHAERSACVWGQLGGSPMEQWLMRNDMALHTLRADELPEFARHPGARLLVVSAVASLMANAKDFGGEESVSFKMKLKHLDRRGKALCKLWNANAPQFA